MSRRIPPLRAENRILILCEGSEEYDYLERLIRCGGWKHCVRLKNVQSIDGLAPAYEYHYQSRSYCLVLVFCDTEKEPYEQFRALKNRIDDFHATHASEHVVFFANPCTMQIILSHFARVRLTTNSKTSNAALIEKLTGVTDYRATEKQRQAVLKKVTEQNYPVMKENLRGLSTDSGTVPSTNALRLFDKLETGDPTWPATVNRAIETAK